MSRLTPDMLQWLTDNREDYEFYMLHAMLHDPLRRLNLLSVPVTPDDFRREEYAIVLRALTAAATIMGSIGQQLPVPPPLEFLRTYIESAAKIEGSDDEVVSDAMKLLRELQNPSFNDQHYCVSPYFEAWYGSVRAKKAARELQKVDIPDVHAQLGNVQKALAAAQHATSADEEDDMDNFLLGDGLERTARRSTGVAGLDDCFNGGWGDHECYLLFGGTGGGKSIAAGQCAWNEAKNNNGWPLIVSTELSSREYAARTVSNAAGVPIELLQDCQNVAQIRQAIGGNQGLSYKLPKADEVVEVIASRFRIHKISADEGMEARMMLEREAMKYEAKMGRLPTWMCLDWLGSVADLGAGGKSSSDRALAWEIAATGCVKFSEDSGIPLLVLAQAVNDAQTKSILTINDIGIAKGIGKNMVVVVGVTNTIDKAGIAAAVTGKGEMPRSMILQDQFFCVAKARKGEGRNVPVRRDFRYQRFIARPRTD